MALLAVTMTVGCSQLPLPEADLSPPGTTPPGSGPTAMGELPATWTPAPTRAPSLTSTPQPTSVPSQTPSRTTEPAQTLAGTAAPEPTFQLQEQELSRGGPWLVYRNADGYLVAIDQDGPGRKIISREDSPDKLVADICNFPSYISAAPTGGLVAFRTALGDNNLKLNIVHLPDGDLIKSIPLLSAENQGDLIAGVASSLAWSPSGRYLAFVGGSEGPSPDLYVYDSQLDAVERLTDGPNSAGQLHWSPDGTWIVHEEITQFPCMRPGRRKATAVWAAAADGSEVIKLYDFPPEATYQYFLGWMTAERFLVGFFNPYDPFENKAYLLDISDAGYATLPYQQFSDIAFSPGENTVLFTITGDERPQVLDPGLYLADLPEGDPVLISSDSGYPVWYPELDRFLVSDGNRTRLVAPRGDLKAVINGFGPWVYPSPDGAYFGAVADGYQNNPGVRIFSRSGGMIREIVFEHYQNHHPYDLFWLPDGTGFFLRGNESGGPGFDLYRVGGLEQEPVLVANDFAGGSFPGPYPDAVWVKK